MWTNDHQGFCPICNDETDQQSVSDDDGTYTTCLECENSLPLPKVQIGDPFLIGDTVYFIHQGNDDGWSLMRWHDEG